MSAPLCILLVDDSPFFLSLERQFLRHTPAMLIEAGSAAEALEQALRYHPSLVFMDIDMPETDGLSCCARFHDDPALRAIPIVLIGDRSRPHHQAAAQACGCAGFLTKPLDRHLFLDTGHKLLVGIDRREPRRDCHIQVDARWHDTVRHGICIDISSGGMFLKIRPMALQGDMLALSLRLPDSHQTPVALTGRVTWVNSPDKPIKPDYPPGYGLEFVDIPEDVAVILRCCFGS